MQSRWHNRRDRVKLMGSLLENAGDLPQLILHRSPFICHESIPIDQDMNLKA
jgi:hypothetical protein